VSECAGVTGEEIEFLLIMRKIEEMWRQGFIGSMTVRCLPNGNLELQYSTVWKPGDAEPKLKG